MAPQTVDPLMVCIVFVISQIKLQDQQQDDAHRNSQGKTEDIENRKKLVFKKNPNKEFEMCGKHIGNVSGEAEIRK
jgi:hypothetical protein